MTTTKSLRSIITLSLALATLLGYSFISAWTAPTGTAPANNVPAPINVGSLAQDKSGTLTAAKLGVIANSPILELIDATTNEKDWRMAVEGGDNFVVRSNRNQNSDWGDDGSHPFLVHSGDTTADDYVQVANKIRATEYCDRGGNNCFKASDVAAQTPAKSCQVKIDAKSLKSDGSGYVYQSGSVTVAIEEGKTARIGGYFQCNTTTGSINNGYFSTKIVSDSWDWGELLDAGGNRTAGGYWSEEDYDNSSTYIDDLNDVAIGSFVVKPGATKKTTAKTTVTSDGCNERHIEVVATVISCEDAAETFVWDVGSYTYSCDEPRRCGNPVCYETRSVVCRNKQGSIVSDSNCAMPKPATQGARNNGGSCSGS